MNTSQKMRNVGKNNFMRKLALSDEILLKISQPARYIGGEVNMVKKDPSKVAVRFAMCFPDVYDIGMSHLGIQIAIQLKSILTTFVKFYYLFYISATR